MKLEIQIDSNEYEIIIQAISDLIQEFWSKEDNGKLILKFKKNIDQNIIDKIIDYKNIPSYILLKGE